jgi:hypothetical protein
MTELSTVVAATDRMEIFLLPHVVKFLDFSTLSTFPFISKITKQSVEIDEIGFWLSCCNSFAHYKGLFMRPNEGTYLQNARKYFFDELFVARRKWKYHEEDDSSNIHTFKIKVSCRFRPGSRGQGNMCLPLHQFLKVRREARAKEKEASTNENISSLLVGEADPIEFLDPFLKTIMREPVLLLSSGKVCERGIAIQCILRGGKDPFNGERLTRDMIVPQDELCASIKAWRIKRESVDVSVAVGDVRSLIDEGAIDPELLDALMEVYICMHMYICLYIYIYIYIYRYL